MSARKKTPRPSKIVDTHRVGGRLAFKVRPPLDVNPGSRVRRLDGEKDEWIVREAWQEGPRTTFVQFNDATYELHIGDELEVVWKNPHEFDHAGRVIRRTV